MKINTKIIIKKVLPVIAGASLGYAYWYFIGCNTGTCPITSNPYTTTVYGALIGAVFALPQSRKKERTNENN